MADVQRTEDSTDNTAETVHHQIEHRVVDRVEARRHLRATREQLVDAVLGDLPQRTDAVRLAD
jgi:hypothetical protein